MKRTEWLQKDYIITNDIHKGEYFKVLEVKPERNGVVIQNVGYKSNNEITFLSDADSTEYFRLTNQSPEYNKQKGELV